MDKQSDEYEYFLTLGTGSNRILLSFSTDERAEIHITSLWMGNEEKVYHLTCLHQAVTRNQGFLRVIKIEQEGVGVLYSQENASLYHNDVYGLQVSEAEEVNQEHEIVCEYLKLSHPAWHFSGHRVIDSIRLTTGAWWNDTFTLFLYLLPDLTNVPKNSETAQIIQYLDRVKFRQIGDDRTPDEDE